MRLFRPARTATPAWNLLKTLLQTAVFWGVFLFALPALLIAAERNIGWPCAPRPVAGAILFAAAGLLGLWSGATMALHGRGTPLPLDAPRELVVAGPYRRLRNPMALAGIVQGIAVGLHQGSPFVIGYALIGAVLWHCTVRPAEERDLAERFGDAFRRYRNQVPLWRPRLRPWTASAREPR
jgi:protein-S-isoprenylcysteine O-methyltransferase Ste14